MGGSDFDRQVDKDWWRFKRGLAAHLAEAPTPHALRLGVVAGTTSLQARLVRDGAETWCLLSLGARPDETLHLALLEIGYRPAAQQRGRRSLTVPGEYVDHVERHTHLQATRLSVRVMEALRRTGVIHPAMLSVSVDGDLHGARSLAW